MRIHIPTPLRPYVDQQQVVEVAGGTVAEGLANLTAKHAALRRHLFTEEGKLRAFVNVYVNDEDIRYLDQQNTPVKEGDVLSIVPSIAGGVELTIVD
jgi:adenylyltransferase/sulfurtransferase